MAGCGGGGPTGPLTAHNSTPPGFCPVFGNWRGSQDQLVHISHFIHKGTEVQRCPPLAQIPRAMLTAEVCPEPGLPPRKCNEECQPRNHSLGQALPPGFVAPTHIVWLDLSWMCPLCLSLVLQLVPGVGVGGSLSALLGCPPQPSLSWRQEPETCVQCPASFLRGATRVPLTHLSRDVALVPIGREDSPFPGGSEMLLECWLLSGVINWPLS